ncbi:hypothetical protein [Tabrizicola soli]|uniref:Uncharacterized protein n=1 Tax=Tabrizicola soli TaxID=2185115 RepID=A0ABV7E009_9RHOB|nr:hypothetical protein [Tabrizicola soli]
MANCTFTTSGRLSEAAPSFTHTPLTQCFIAVMRDLSAYIEAEQDLEHCDSFDPACDAWISDAERARTCVLDRLALLHVAPVRRREDIPLRHFGKVTRLLIESETPEAFGQALALPSQFASFFKCHGDSATARRVNLMIAGFQAQLRNLETLADFAAPVAAEYCGIDADEADALMAPAA